MRLFFALPVDIENKLAIEHWRNRVFPRDIRPIPIDNYHITLNFLGEVKMSALDRLCSEATEAIRSLAPPPLRINIDQCAYWSGPGILWIGPQLWPEAVDRLQQKLARLAHTIGMKQSKRAYQPHISLFRSKTALPKPLLEPAFSLEANELILYESVQKKQGVQYECVEQWTFGSPELQQNVGNMPPGRYRKESSELS